MFSGYESAGNFLGASALANPSIPNFSRSIAAARRDIRQHATKTKTSAPRFTEKSEKSADSSSSSNSMKYARRNVLRTSGGQEMLEMLEKRIGRANSNLESGSALHTGEQDASVKPSIATHNNKNLSAPSSNNKTKKSLTKVMGIARIDPKTLKVINEPDDTPESLSQGDYVTSRNFVPPPPPEPPASTPPNNFNMDSTLYIDETEDNVASHSVSPSPSLHSSTPSISQLHPSDKMPKPKQSAFVAHHILDAIRYRRSLYGLQLTDARSVFEAMDRDGDGELSKSEFEKALNRLGMGLKKNQIQALVAAMGRSEKGGILFEAFLQMMGPGSKPRKQRHDMLQKSAGAKLKKRRQNSLGIVQDKFRETNVVQKNVRARNSNAAVGLSNIKGSVSNPHSQHVHLRRSTIANTKPSTTSAHVRKGDTTGYWQASVHRKKNLSARKKSTFTEEKKARKKKTPPKGPEFERVGSAFYRRKINTAKRAREIKKHISPTMPRYSKSKQHAAAELTSSSGRTQQKRSRAESITSADKTVSKKRRNSYKTKSGGAYPERLHKRMGQSLRYTSSSRENKQIVGKRSNGDFSSEDEAESITQAFQRPPWRSTTKIVRKGRMISAPSGELAADDNGSDPDQTSRLTTSKAGHHEAKRSNGTSKSTSTGGLSKARFCEDLSETVKIPGTSDFPFKDRMYQDSCEIFAQILCQGEIPADYHHDIVEEIRRRFQALDSRRTGTISVADLRQSLLDIDIGINSAGADAVCGAASTSRDGFLYYPEYLVTLKASLSRLSTENAKSPLKSSSDETASEINDDNGIVLTQEQIKERERIMSELKRLGIEFAAADFSAANDESGKQRTSINNSGIIEDNTPQRRTSGFDSSDPRLNRNYGDPTKLSLSSNPDSIENPTRNRDNLKVDIMRWQLHRAAHGKGKTNHTLKARFRELNEARNSVAKRTNFHFDGDNGAHGRSKFRRNDTFRTIPPWRQSHQSRSVRRRSSVSIRGVVSHSPKVQQQDSRRMFIYDLGENGIAQGPTANHAREMHGRVRGSSIVVTMVEAAIIHFQVSTMEKCFYALRDWVDRVKWEREKVQQFQNRTATRILPKALALWRNAFRCRRFYFLRTTSKCIEAWKLFTHESQQESKMYMIAKIYNILRIKVRTIHKWRELSAAATVKRYQTDRANIFFRRNTLLLGLRAFRNNVENKRVDYYLEDRAMRHHVQGLAGKVVAAWRGVADRSRIERIFTELGRLRCLARRFSQLRLGVEICKDDRVQARHSDVYRKIFTMSRSFQSWQKYVYVMRRYHWADGIHRNKCLKLFIAQWRAAKDALVAERHRREASDMLFEHRCQKRFFYKWNSSIHEKYMERVSTAISNVLDTRYAVLRWRKWATCVKKYRIDNDKATIFFLRRQFCRWRKEVSYKLGEILAARHYVSELKRKGVTKLLDHARSRIHLRKLTIDAWAYNDRHTMANFLDCWIDFIREKQEMRGKQHLAYAHYRSVLLRRAFSKVGHTIFVYKSKEVEALKLHKQHKRRRVRVSHNGTNITSVALHVSLFLLLTLVYLRIVLFST